MPAGQQPETIRTPAPLAGPRVEKKVAKALAVIPESPASQPPNADHDAGVLDPDRPVRKLPDGGHYTGIEFATLDPEALHMMRSAMKQQVTPRIRKCTQDLTSRLGKATPQEDLRFEVNFTVTSKNAKGTLQDIGIGGKDGKWPVVIDQEAQACYLRAFQGVDIETDPTDFSYPLSYPILLKF